MNGGQTAQCGAPAGVGAAGEIGIGLIGAGAECDGGRLVAESGNRNRASEKGAEGTHRKGVGP